MQTSLLTLATAAMLVQQTLSYLCQLVLPILAGPMADALGVTPKWLGVFQFLTHSAGVVAALGCSGFILRWGAIRVSQVTLAGMAAALLIASLAELWLMPVAALLLGLTYAMTPASSHVLARFCPPHLAPLIFSVKQTGVPAGSLVAGFAVPVFYAAFGLRGAFVATAVVAFACVAALQSMRRRFDDDRQQAYPLAMGDIRSALTDVLKSAPLRALAFTAFSLGGLQSIFATFFVIYLTTDLGFTIAAASEQLGIAGATAVITRIGWGWLGGRHVAVRRLLAALALGGAAAGVATGLFAPAWPLVAITAVAVVYNATAISWHGVLLAEVARLAPQGRVGAVTGGVLAYTGIAMMTYPLAFSAIAAAAGSYGAGFLVLAAPALAVGLLLLRPAAV